LGGTLGSVGHEIVERMQDLVARAADIRGYL
jgi:hypothetical protein